MTYTPKIQFVGNSSRSLETFSDNDWALLTRMERAPADERGEMEETMVEDTPLLINIKGCGYPPNIVCDEYAETFENISRVGDGYSDRLCVNDNFIFRMASRSPVTILK